MITYNKLRKSIVVNMADVRVKTYTVMGVTFLTIIVLTVFAIRPVVERLSSEIGLLNEYQQNDQQVKQNLSNLAADEAIYDSQVKGNTDVLNTALPFSPETGPLFANMNAIAQSHKLQFTSLQFIKAAQLTQIHSTQQPVNPVGNALPLYFSVSGNGAASDFVAFEKDLESYPRVFTIQSISLNTDYDTKSGKAGNSHFSFTGYVFYIATPQGS